MPDAHFRVVDLETVGFLDEQPQAIQDEPHLGIVEIGFTDIRCTFRDGGGLEVSEIDKPGFVLCNPPGGIPPASMGIHHITPRMVQELPPCSASLCLSVLTSPPTPTALIAHNAKFERTWLDKYLPKEVRWVDTYKVAKRLHPTWPAHSNQACRYLLGLELDDRFASPPHRGGPDSWVSAHLFVEFLKEGCSVRQMVEWTLMPTLQVNCEIGEHRGKPWIEVPTSYLEWIVGPKPTSMDEDTRWNAQQALQDRRRLAAQPDLASSEY